MWKYSKSTDHQPGFTLVELAIVLVIIGLILAAVLKGQEMIQNAKVKNVINDLRGVSTAYYAYQDRFKAIPGDDANASTHFTGGINGNGDGIIAGLFNATATPVDGATTESNKFWLSTRLAGFMTGSGSNPATNALGGMLGIQDGNSTTGTVLGMTGPVACVGNIPWKIAVAVDAVLDDGNSGTGTVRTGTQSATANVTPDTTAVTGIYGSSVTATTTLEAGMSTVCMKI
jgi:prepilin-type N-terminal cleavage/methylation domain-containing protein